MSLWKTCGVSTLDELQRRVRARLRQYCAALQRSGVAPDELAELSGLFEALPLASDEFALACRRLENARRYLSAGERGAARYELQLLEGGLMNASAARAGNA